MRPTMRVRRAVRPARAAWRAAWTCTLLTASAACGGRAPSPTPAPASPAASAAPALARAESLYADLHNLRDRMAVTSATGRPESPDGVPLATLAGRSTELRRTLLAQLAAIDSAPLAGDDRRALATMRRTLDAGMGEAPEEGSASGATRP